MLDFLWKSFKMMQFVPMFVHYLHLLPPILSIFPLVALVLLLFIHIKEMILYLAKADTDKNEMETQV